MMRELAAAISDVDVVVALEPEELGKRILFLLRARPATDVEFHPSHWRGELAPGFFGAPPIPRRGVPTWKPLS